jgi:hypothetical protein
MRADSRPRISPFAGYATPPDSNIFYESRVTSRADSTLRLSSALPRESGHHLLGWMPAPLALGPRPLDREVANTTFPGLSP